MKASQAEKIISDIETGYDLIADKFSGTRAFMWRDLGFIKDMVKPEDRVLDFGCGNGRLAGFLDGNYKEFVGVDISQKLIDIAKQKYSSEKTEFIKISANAKRSDRAAKERMPAYRQAGGRTSFVLPFKNSYFDVIFSIAVFHHFPSKAYALSIAKELHRVLKPGGKIVVTAWNLWQKRFLRFSLKKDESDWESLYIPFKAGDKVFERYHHPFKIVELENIFQEAGFKKLKTKKAWNLLYIGQKTRSEK